MTKQQRLILAHIVSTVKERGYPPSVREIGNHVGLSSSSSVAHHLKKLQEKGFIELHGVARGITILKGN